MRQQTPRSDAAVRHPLEATFAGHFDRVFLRENGQAWSVGRLLALAADVSAAVPSGTGPRVGVRARSAAFVVASLLGLWKDGRYPILLDPTLADEVGRLQALPGVAATFVPAWELALPGDIRVAETGQVPLEPAFPSRDDLILAFLTSGSTGEPKVVLKRDYQFRDQFAVEPDWLRLSGPVTAVSLVPSHHILGYIYGFNMPAGTGGHVTFLPGSSPQAWVEAIRRDRPSLVVGVPLHYRLMSQALNAPLPESVYLSSGGPLPEQVAEAFRQRAGWPIVQVYGSTEAAGIATCTGRSPLTPMPRVQWRARPDDGRLLIRSPWQDDPDAWHCLDDVIEPAGDGFELVGRADSVVKVGGRRFSLAEVVQAALSAPSIDQAHAVPYDRYGELAVALFVVPRPPRSASTAEVRAFLAGRLAPFKVPRTIRVLDELPAHGIGKVDEQALRRLAVADPDGTALP